MRYICSGTTGINKIGAVEELRKLKNGDNIRIICLEEYLKEKGNFDDITLFLNSYNWQVQKNAWERAFSEILEDIEKKEVDVTILFMHLVYLRNSRFLSPLNINLIEKFNPDGFITFIDDVYLLRKRIQDRSETTPFKTELHLRDLLAWRSIETNLTDILSSHLTLSYNRKIPNFILSVKHPITTLHNLIYDAGNLKTYIAHPISNTRNISALVDEIEIFKSQLHKNFTVFDPTTIDERLLSISLKEQYPDWKTMSRGVLAESIVKIEYDQRWPIRHRPLLCTDVDDLFPLEVPADEIVEVIQDIDNQIQNRDYRLISQSDAVVCYRPNLGGVLSTGVYSEMQYARDVAFKPCYMYFPECDGDHESTPFKGRGASYQSTDELIRNLMRHRDEK
jgi:adenylate kinase